MSLYENLKGIAKVVRQIDNIDLYTQLIDLSAQALDLQNEVVRLTEENQELKKKNDIAERIERHMGLFITLTESDIMYCSHCWDSKEKLIQVSANQESGQFTCPHCNHRGTYDEGAFEQYRASQRARIAPRRSSNVW